MRDYNVKKTTGKVNKREMVGFDRETLTIAATIICLVTCFYLYKENQKQKEELANFTTKVVSQLSRAPVNEDRKPVRVKKSVVVEEVEDEENDD